VIKHCSRILLRYTVTSYLVVFDRSVEWDLNARVMSWVAIPDLTIFVGDSLTGNDAVTQADEFNRLVGMGASILTKFDADAKGGASISIAYVTKKHVIYLGNGQEQPLLPEIKKIVGDNGLVSVQDTYVT